MSLRQNTLDRGGSVEKRRLKVPTEVGPLAYGDPEEDPMGVTECYRSRVLLPESVDTYRGGIDPTEKSTRLFLFRRV